MLTIFRPNNLTAFLRCIIFVSESTLRLPLLPLLPFRLPAPSLLPPRGILLISLVSLISHDGLIINQIPTPVLCGCLTVRLLPFCCKKATKPAPPTAALCAHALPESC